MNPPSLLYPVKPLSVNQPFGANVAYYETNFGQKGHPGIDFMASHGQPVFAAHDGAAIYIKDSHGGEGIWLYAPGYITIYWHLIGDTDATLPPPIPYNTNGVRTPVKAGDLIGYADNTGAPFESSGDHLHFGLILTYANGVILNEDNGTQGCIDPQPYFNGQFAVDIPLAAIKTQATQLAQAVAVIKPTDPNAPAEVSLLDRVLAVLKEELGEIL
jgi:murein DD-endopeptidase MepM/ murein hydrolase activator NlpD